MLHNQRCKNQNPLRLPLASWSPILCIPSTWRWRQYFPPKRRWTSHPRRYYSSYLLIWEPQIHLPCWLFLVRCLFSIYSTLKMEAEISPKRRFPSTALHIVTLHRTVPSSRCTGYTCSYLGSTQFDYRSVPSCPKVFLVYLRVFQSNVLVHVTAPFIITLHLSFGTTCYVVDVIK
jgi:hypothetical protein